jgi:hypothetical protein
LEGKDAEPPVHERLSLLAAQIDVVAARIGFYGMKRAAADLQSVAAAVRAMIDAGAHAGHPKP